MTMLSLRLAYDDASTPHDMYGDCQAAGANLHLPVRTTPVPRRIGLERYRQQPPTVFIVHDEVAATAGRLHLHFD